MDKIAKAIMGGLAGGLSALGTALADGQIVATEWVLVASSILGAFTLVWGVPNTPE